MKSRKISQAGTYNHCNPNPQNGDWIFKGPRDIGYGQYNKTQDPVTGIIRFGKKIDYGNKKMTNDQLMQTHLKQIRDKVNSQSNTKETNKM